MISVIIPVFNTAHYLNKCVESIVNQSFIDWECILVDDGSSDGCELICDDWSCRDPRILAIHQNNEGVSAARNRGLQLARGELITFVDSDDWVEKEYLLYMYNALHDSGADLAVSGLVLDFENGTHEVYRPDSDSVFNLTPLNTDRFVALNEKSLLYGPVVKLYRNQIIKNNNILFNNKYSYGEDLLFNYQYLNYVNSIATISTVQYHYRISNSYSLSKRFRPDKFDLDYEQWQILKEFYLAKGLWNKSSKQFLYKRLWGCIYDGIFIFPLLPDKHISYLKRILSIPEIDELEAYQEQFQCRFWIKKAILMRCFFVFYVFFILVKKK